MQRLPVPFISHLWGCKPEISTGSIEVLSEFHLIHSTVYTHYTYIYIGGYMHSFRSISWHRQIYIFICIIPTTTVTARQYDNVMGEKKMFFNYYKRMINCEKLQYH